jgi:glycerol 2-dehydrogenase (NADP+)
MKHLKDWDFIKTWTEMMKLPASGRVKNIGVCNLGRQNLEKLLSHPSCTTVPAVLQIEVRISTPPFFFFLNEDGRMLNFFVRV